MEVTESRTDDLDSDSCDSLLELVKDLDSDGFHSDNEMSKGVTTESESDTQPVEFENNGDVIRLGIGNGAVDDVCEGIVINGHEECCVDCASKDSRTSVGSDNILAQFLDSSTGDVGEHFGTSL